MNKEHFLLPQAHPVPLDSSDGKRRGFGEAFTPSMAFAEWDAKGDWQPLQLGPRRPLLLDPASASLHYGQAVFEGLKAYRTSAGDVAVFRADAHGRRLQQSARRFSLAEPPVELLRAAVCGVARTDAEWLPDDPNAGLYLRPVLMATEPSLALRPARSSVLIVLAFATGGFFADQPDPIQVWIEREYVRAVPGGTGSAKCAGNYAPGYLAQARAAQKGCDQVIWLDALDRIRVEEMGGMNLFFIKEGDPGPVVSTPPLTDTVLPGITRDTIIQIARLRGLRVCEEVITVDEWRDGARSGHITEVFACGTAAGVTPVGCAVDGDVAWTIGKGNPGRVTLELRQALWDAQHGVDFQEFGWLD
jgi:branched-chain amino acid aminotransferase